MVTTTGFSVNGKPVVTQLDTLFAGTLLIYPPATAALGLQHGAASPAWFAYTDDGDDDARCCKHHRIRWFRSRARTSVYFVTKGMRLPDGLFEGTVG